MACISWAANLGAAPLHYLRSSKSDGSWPEVVCKTALAVALLAPGLFVVLSCSIAGAFLSSCASKQISHQSSLKNKTPPAPPSQPKKSPEKPVLDPIRREEKLSSKELLRLELPREEESEKFREDVARLEAKTISLEELKLLREQLEACRASIEDFRKISSEAVHFFSDQEMPFYMGKLSQFPDFYYMEEPSDELLVYLNKIIMSSLDLGDKIQSQESRSNAFRQIILMRENILIKIHKYLYERYERSAREFDPQSSEGLEEFYPLHKRYCLAVANLHDSLNSAFSFEGNQELNQDMMKKLAWWKNSFPEYRKYSDGKFERGPLDYNARRSSSEAQGKLEELSDFEREGISSSSTPELSDSSYGSLVTFKSQEEEAEFLGDIKRLEARKISPEESARLDQMILFCDQLLKKLSFKEFQLTTFLKKIGPFECLTLSSRLENYLNMIRNQKFRLYLTINSNDGGSLPEGSAEHLVTARIGALHRINALRDSYQQIGRLYSPESSEELQKFRSLNFEYCEIVTELTQAFQNIFINNLDPEKKIDNTAPAWEVFPCFNGSLAEQDIEWQSPSIIPQDFQGKSSSSQSIEKMDLLPEIFDEKRGESSYVSSYEERKASLEERLKELSLLVQRLLVQQVGKTIVGYQNLNLLLSDQDFEFWPEKGFSCSGLDRALQRAIAEFNEKGQIIESYEYYELISKNILESLEGYEKVIAACQSNPVEDREKIQPFHENLCKAALQAWRHAKNLVRLMHHEEMEKLADTQISAWEKVSAQKFFS